MDLRNLVISIVTCDVPEAYGRAERPFFARTCETFVVRGEIQSKFECLDFTRSFCYLNVDWHSLHALWATEDSIKSASADIGPNPTSWSTFGIACEWHTPLDVIVVWSLHA